NRSRRHLSISFWKRSRLPLLEPLLENLECWPVEFVAAGGLQPWFSLSASTYASLAGAVQLANRQLSQVISPSGGIAPLVPVSAVLSGARGLKRPLPRTPIPAQTGLRKISGTPCFSGRGVTISPW